MTTDSAPCRPGEPEAPELLELPIAGEPEPELGADGDQAAAGAGAVLPREAFRAGFDMAFRFAGSLTGLKTLAQAPDRPDAAAAADCLYDCALETPWLRWLIEPSNIWLQRTVVLGAFAVPLALEARAELRERREAAAAARAKPVGPDQAPPPRGT